MVVGDRVDTLISRIDTGIDVATCLWREARAALPRCSSSPRGASTSAPAVGPCAEHNVHVLFPFDSRREG